MRHVLSALALLSALVMSASARASTITYTETATLSGTLGATSFTNALVTFTQVADPSTAFAFATNVYGNDGGISTVNIAGVGTATFLNSTFGAVSQNYNSAYQGVGFYDSATNFSLADQGNFLIDYNLMSSAGPVTGITQSNGTQHESTSSGALTITAFSGTGGATFTAAVTPEPSSLLLLGTGLLSLMGAARRKSL